VNHINLGGATTSGFAALALASQAVNVSGNVYRLANPGVQNALVLAARVGDALPSRSITVSNVSPNAFTERLNASLGTVSPAFSSSGVITGLQAASSSNALGFTLNSTALAGSTTGTAAVNLVSSGAGTTLAPDAALGTATVALRGVSVSNTAGGALADGLRAKQGVSGAPFVPVGGVAGLAAGGTSASGLLVGLNTGSAGMFNGSSTVSFTSQNPDMADLALGTASVTLRGQVNNIAQSTLQRTAGAGTFGNVGLNYTLNFGTLAQGAAPVSALLSLANTATGQSSIAPARPGGGRARAGQLGVDARRGAAAGQPAAPTAWAQGLTKPARAAPSPRRPGPAAGRRCRSSRCTRR